MRVSQIFFPTSRYSIITLLLAIHLSPIEHRRYQSRSPKKKKNNESSFVRPKSFPFLNWLDLACILFFLVRLGISLFFLSISLSPFFVDFHHKLPFTITIIIIVLLGKEKEAVVFGWRRRGWRRMFFQREDNPCRHNHKTKRKNYYDMTWPHDRALWI